MKIYVDADAFPKELREPLCRAIQRFKIKTVFVSAGFLRLTQSEYISFINVPEAFNAADDKIVEIILKDDLVITADIPLADRVVSAGAFALDPRGEFFTTANIKQRLAVRNLMSELRSSGMEIGGPASYNPKNKEAFINKIDSFLTKQKRLEEIERRAAEIRQNIPEKE